MKKINNILSYFNQLELNWNLQKAQERRIMTIREEKANKMLSDLGRHLIGDNKEEYMKVLTCLFVITDDSNVNSTMEFCWKLQQKVVEFYRDHANMSVPESCQFIDNGILIPLYNMARKYFG